MASFLFLFLFPFLAGIPAGTAHNVTHLLSTLPEYSVFNDYLSRTKVSDEINTRTTVTVLVLSNAVATSLVSGKNLNSVKNLLELHVLLDYFDDKKLHNIAKGTMISTTLFQTTGNADDKAGFVNITDLHGGRVAFGSAVVGSPLSSTFTKMVKTVPYNISIVEISSPIVASGIAGAPSPSAAEVNLTAAMVKSGCKIFAGMITQTGVLKTFQSVSGTGLTVFAPIDAAFNKSGLPDFSKLTSAETVDLLEYHAAADYMPMGALKTKTGAFSTLATNAARSFQLSTRRAGDSVTLVTGIDTARVNDIIVDNTPLAVFVIDSVLLPKELFPTAPSSSPAVSPSSRASPAPSPGALAPSPGSAKAPSSVVSPPAPPEENSPAGSPDMAPVAEVTGKKRSAAVVGFRVDVCWLGLSVLLSLFMC